jgi:hypothetical protein
MRKAADAAETSYVLLFASLLGLLVGLGLLVYGWPQPCGAFIPCGNSYSLVIFGVLIMVVSVGLMAYSIKNHTLFS